MCARKGWYDRTHLGNAGLLEGIEGAGPGDQLHGARLMSAQGGGGGARARGWVGLHFRCAGIARQEDEDACENSCFWRWKHTFVVNKCDPVVSPVQSEDT